MAIRVGDRFIDVAAEENHDETIYLLVAAIIEESNAGFVLMVNIRTGLAYTDNIVFVRNLYNISDGEFQSICGGHAEDFKNLEE